MNDLSAPRPEQSLMLALGELLVSFSALEDSLHLAIFKVVPVHGGLVANVLTAGLSFSTLVEKFGALYFELFPSEREDIGKICARLNQLNERRNALVHSVWMFEAGTGSGQRMKTTARAKHGLRTHMEGVEPSVVQALVAEIDALDDDLTELIVSRSDQ